LKFATPAPTASTSPAASSPGGVRQPGLHQVLSLPEQGIGEIDPGRAHFDQHCSGRHGRLWHLGDFHHLGAAKTVEYYCFHVSDLIQDGLKIFG
jgi:hypothetical protein